MQWTKTSCVAAMLCSVAVVGNAQLADSNRTFREDGRIEIMNRFVNLKLSLSNDMENISVRTPSQKLVLNPNGNANFKLGFNYRFIAFSVKFAPGFLGGTNDNAIRGKTRFQGFGTELNFKQSFHQLSYRRTRGFYLENTGDFNPTWQPGQAYFQFPKLYFTQFQLVSGYNFNPALSVNSLVAQTERQLKSAGAFMPYISLRYYTVEDKTPLTATSSSQRSSNFEWLVAPSYLYNHILKNDFYLAAGGGAGIGVLFTSLDTRTQNSTTTTKANDFLVRWHARAGIGHNGPRFFAGAYFDAQGASFKQQNTTATNREVRLFYSLFSGYRFNAPGTLKRLTDKASRLI